MAGEKTEKATPKRRKDERKKGNVPQSKDITNVISMLVVFSILKIIFPYIYQSMKRYILFILGEMSNIEAFTFGGMITVLVETVKVFTIATIPLLIIGMTISIVGTGMQTRFLFSMEPLKPKFDKFNPINGIKRIFSIRSGVELIKNMLKLTIITVILYNFIIKRIESLAEMLFLGIEQGAAYTLDAVVSMVYAVCLIFVFVNS